MIRPVHLALALALTAVPAACGKGDGKGGAKGGGDLPADHVAAVNAALPAELKGKLEFEAGRVVENERRGRAFKLAVPKGWKKGRFMEGTLEPPDADSFGSKTLGRTQLGLGRSCDGECVKKDWAAASDKELFGPYTSGKSKGKVLKDEKRPNGRTLVFEVEPSAFPEKDVAVYVFTAWWDPEGSEYFSCKAELGQPVKGAADAFEKACAKVIKE